MNLNKMALSAYITLVKAGKRELSDIPAGYRKAVEERLEIIESIIVEGS